MEEFKQLPWPEVDVGTNLEEAYALNMAEYRKNNPTDIFFCHLLEFDPLHYQHVHQKFEKPDADPNLIVNQFKDPRTGVEIPSYECNYKTNNNPESKNIFLKNYIQASKLQTYEHSACLHALKLLNKDVSQMTAQEKTNFSLYESTSTVRLEEKNAYLEKLRKHYFRKLSKRYHNVPPAIGYFINHVWKKQLIELYRKLVKTKYQLKTAVLFQSAEQRVTCDVLYQEHLGSVPKINAKNVEYLRESYPNLIDAYNARKSTRLNASIKDKLNELVENYGIEFVVPISILKCILSHKKGWSCLMTVEESADSTIFNPIKRIVFNKPLPPTYLSGNERYKKGAKYLIRSCFNRFSQNVYDHSKQKEQNLNIDVESIEHSSGLDAKIEYKVTTFDEFVRKYRKQEISKENMSFTIFNVTGYDDMEDTSETIKVLVPTKLDAYDKDENQEVQFMNYSAKIEFQAEYGAEEMTKAELIREWCDLYFRQNTITQRVRFDCGSGKILRRQSIGLNDVENELKSRHGIESQKLLQELWHVLQTFNQFPAGEYFLHQDSKQTDYVKIYEKTDRSNDSFDVLGIFKNISFGLNIFEKAEWQPIDDKIATEIHEIYQILPCAYPHDEYINTYNVRSPKKKYHAKSVNAIAGVRKIDPIDDSRKIMRKIQEKQKECKRQISGAKKKKKNTNRSRKKALKRAQESQAKSAKSALKQTIAFVTATMDEYQTMDGKSINEQQEDTSIATSSQISSQVKDTPNVEPSETTIRRSRRTSNR